MEDVYKRQGHNNVVALVARFGGAGVQFHIGDDIAAEGTGLEVEALIGVVVLGVRHLREGTVRIDLIEVVVVVILIADREEHLAGTVELRAISVPEVQFRKRILRSNRGVEVGVEIKQGLGLAGNVNGKGRIVIKAKLNLFVTCLLYTSRCV